MQAQRELAQVKQQVGICGNCQRMMKQKSAEPVKEQPPQLTGIASLNSTVTKMMQKPSQTQLDPPKRMAFTAAQIEQLPFKLKQEDFGNVQEKCATCKWFIEPGHYLLELGCGHRFHKKCMEMWLVTSNLCPSCKEVCTFTSAIQPDKQ